MTNVVVGHLKVTTITFKRSLNIQCHTITTIVILFTGLCHASVFPTLALDVSYALLFLMLLLPCMLLEKYALVINSLYYTSVNYYL